MVQYHNFIIIISYRIDLLPHQSSVSDDFICFPLQNPNTFEIFVSIVPFSEGQTYLNSDMTEFL